MDETTLAVEVDERADEQRVTAALVECPGVQWATALADSGRVRVRFDPDRIDRSELVVAVKSAGYDGVE